MNTDETGGRDLGIGQSESRNPSDFRVKLVDGRRSVRSRIATLTDPVHRRNEVAYKILPTAEELRSFFAYDPENGVLRWRILTGRAVVGRRAGRMVANGYRSVTARGVTMSEHRVIWKIMTGCDPTHQIDHINGDRADNRWCNLRSATHSENQRNKAAQSRSASPYKGISWCKTTKQWRTAIRVDGESRYLGRFATPEEARAAYAEAVSKFHGEFGRAS